MNFNTLLSNTTTKRDALKPAFTLGVIPTQDDFHEMIDGLFLLQGDTLYKDASSGLGIQAGTDAAKTALLLYNDPTEEPVWSIGIRNDADTQDDFQLKDSAGTTRLTVTPDGKVGIGTINPGNKLEVAGNVQFLSGTHHFYINEGELFDASIAGIRNNNGSPVLNAKNDGIIYLNRDVNADVLIESWDGTTLREIAAFKKDGNVGVGTTSPGGQLHLASDSDHELKITRANGMYGLQIRRDASAGIFYIQNTDDSNNWGTRIRINEGGDWQHLLLNPDGGNVGIGTIAPTEKLNVYNGNLRMDNGFVRFENTPSSPSGITGYALMFYRDGAYYNYNTGFGQSSDRDVWFNAYEGSLKLTWAGNDRVTFNLRSNVAAYYVMDAHGKIAASDGVVHTSDRRFKKNVETLDSDALTKLGQLRGTTFQWRADEFKSKNFSEGKKTGFIAQEFAKVYPELVSEDFEGNLSINYTGLIPILVEASKQQKDKIEALKKTGKQQKKKIKALEKADKQRQSKIDALEKMISKKKMK